METFFHNDPKIEEWVNQITEKIFTVCLLTGIDSEAEFHKGCLIVTKIASVLLGFSTIPQEYLEDGLRQLLEQQLPDVRVINNFPTFHETKNRMIHEGISKVIDSQKIVTEKAIEEAIEEPTEEDRKGVSITNERAEGELNVTLKEAVIEEVIGLNSETKVAFNNDLLDSYDVTRQELRGKLNEELQNDSEIEEFRGLEQTDLTHAQSQSNELMCTQVSERAERLKYILSLIFPNMKITLNFNLMGQTFLAQVKNILIFLQDPHHPLNLQIYNREGWRVFVCNTEDLKFPRRLERRIRQFQRLGKKS